jgi:hypothetical protein
MASTGERELSQLSQISPNNQRGTKHERRESRKQTGHITTTRVT